MADLARLRKFADEHGFGLTAPLHHEQVRQLADYWVPDMFFYWDEHFHPITLDDMFGMVDAHFEALPAEARDSWRLTQMTRDGLMPAPRVFDPPVVRIPDGLAGTQLAFRVLASGAGAREALRLPEVGSITSFTHGASFRTGDGVFGGKDAIGGGKTPSRHAPLLPRASEPDPDNAGEMRSRITVMASFFNLVDLLKYELLAAQAGDDYPSDGLRGGFNIVDSLLKPTIASPPVFLPSAKRAYLLEMIRAFESNSPLEPPPPGWRLDRVASDAVMRFAFLEYDFFYAYNDFERYQTAIFDNQHEGDNEGCCLVFERNAIIAAAANPDPEALLRVTPHSIITSVHEEHHQSDKFKFVPPPPPASDPTLRARELVDFTVYIAGGSHATYLTKGTHDLVDFQDSIATISQWHPLLVLPLLPVAILLAMIEHFVDTEDFTSDDGIRAGRSDRLAPGPDAVATNVLTMPMSADNHIYMGDNEPLLLLRAFAGKWGGHAGLIDKSSAFEPKSGRYFRNLVDRLNG